MRLQYSNPHPNDDMNYWYLMPFVHSCALVVEQPWAVWLLYHHTIHSPFHLSPSFYVQHHFSCILSMFVSLSYSRFFRFLVFAWCNRRSHVLFVLLTPFTFGFFNLVLWYIRGLLSSHFYYRCISSSSLALTRSFAWFLSPCAWLHRYPYHGLRVSLLSSSFWTVNNPLHFSGCEKACFVLLEGLQ